MHRTNSSKWLGAMGLCAMLAFAVVPCAGADLFQALKVTRMPAGMPVAPFALRTLDGQVVDSASLAGKVVLLNFWATWCGPCKEEMPSLDRLRRRLDPQHFTVLTITTDHQPEGIRSFLTGLGIGLPVLFDEDQEVSRSFMVRGLPTTVLIGPDGRMAGRAVGPRAWDSPEAVALLQDLLK